MANATYSLISSNTLSGNSTTGITWSNIPQTFDDLVIITNWTAINISNIFMRFNNDSTASAYINTQLFYYTGGASVISGSSLSNKIDCLTVTGGSTNGTWSNQQLYINEYRNTNIWKSITTRGGNNKEINFASATWKNTSSIDRIDIFPDGTLSANSIFTLYGIKAG